MALRVRAAAEMLAAHAFAARHADAGSASCGQSGLTNQATA